MKILDELEIPYKIISIAEVVFLYPSNDRIRAVKEFITENLFIELNINKKFTDLCMVFEDKILYLGSRPNV